jgi:hypothetical protein
LKSGDAIKCRWRHGAERPFTSASFPPATLIRLYELLKNNSRLSKSRLANHSAGFLALWFATL